MVQVACDHTTQAQQIDCTQPIVSMLVDVHNVGFANHVSALQTMYWYVPWEIGGPTSKQND